MLLSVCVETGLGEVTISHIGYVSTLWHWSQQIAGSLSLTSFRHMAHGYGGGSGELGPGLSSISPLRTMIHSSRIS